MAVPVLRHPGRLRRRLLAAGYTVDGVSELLGDAAMRALRQGDAAPAIRATAGGGGLATLIRLFLLGRPVPAEDAVAVLPDEAELLARVNGPTEQLRARLDIRPHAEDDADWYVVSDPSPMGRRLPTNHVPGIGAASLTLLAAMVRRPAATALDVGTGSGVVALHLGRHAERVTATDVSPRALAMAVLTFALSDVPVETALGDGLDAVQGRTFDLVVSNPPFVVGPGRLTYRDGGAGVCQRLTTAAARHLTPGGIGQLLVSWPVTGEDWAEPVLDWLPPGCDALVLLRELLDPADHVRTWVGEGGGSTATREAEALHWLDELVRRQVAAIAYGIITLRRTDAAPRIRMVDVRADAPPTGERLAGWLDRVERLREIDPVGPVQPRTLVLARPPRLRLETQSAVGPDGWQPLTQTLCCESALPQRLAADELVAALVAGCDGVLSLQTVLTLLAAATDTDEAALAALALRLVDAGYLVPV